jgi:putative hemolysin
MNAAGLLAMVLLAAGCAATAPPVQRANPASQNCVQQGGKHMVERGPGGEMGVCLFEDNRQCEEWALLRGQCPKGGIRVAGFATTEERHCAIRGGQTTSAGECRLP